MPKARQSVSLLGLLGVFALSACIPPSPEPTPAPSPSPPPIARPPAPPPPARAPVNWQDAPQSPGDWRYVRQGQMSQALFGEAQQGARLAISCDLSTRRVSLARAGNTSGRVTMTVRTEFQDQALNAGGQDMGTPMIAAQLAAADPLLDAMAFSKGRFAVEVPGTAPLYPPAWPEIIRVVEDCRS